MKQEYNTLLIHSSLVIVERVVLMFLALLMTSAALAQKQGEQLGVVPKKRMLYLPTSPVGILVMM